ncbi:MAG TPA: GNAT family N-acetyltransferase [Saprospiraceae bacterium]|nr:GNAT family N-acetyltransferase [Saprospiraceae bacterium]
MTQFYFIQMDGQDLPLCLQFLYDAALRLKNRHIEQWQYWLDPPKDKVEWVKKGIENGEFYKVYNENDQIIAMFRLLSSDDLYWGPKDDNARYIHSLVVSDNAIGNGIGKSIIKTIEKNILAEGIELLRLDCNATNKELCAYYENLGFLKVGTVQMPYSLNALYEKKLV